MITKKTKEKRNYEITIPKFVNNGLRWWISRMTFIWEFDNSWKFHKFWGILFIKFCKEDWKDWNLFKFVSYECTFISFKWSKYVKKIKISKHADNLKEHCPVEMMLCWWYSQLPVDNASKRRNKKEVNVIDWNHTLLEMSKMITWDVVSPWRNPRSQSCPKQRHFLS